MRLLRHEAGIQTVYSPVVVALGGTKVGCGLLADKDIDSSPPMGCCDGWVMTQILTLTIAGDVTLRCARMGLEMGYL